MNKVMILILIPLALSVSACGKKGDLAPPLVANATAELAQAEQLAED